MKEFEGTLDSIDPRKLITKDQLNDFDSFFLVLGVIFNDFKSLLQLVDLFNRTYTEPRDRTPSVHLGEYYGIQIYVFKTALGILSNFFTFLRENKSVIGTINFKVFEQKLPKEILAEWNEILNVLSNVSHNKYLNRLAEIRSNVTYHFDEGLTQVKTGYTEKFYRQAKDEANKYAFYSLGSNSEATRFYYCDGAIEEYLKSKLNFSKSDSYYNLIDRDLRSINKTIRVMMHIYLESKK